MSTREVIGVSLFEYLCHPENSLRAGKRCEKADNEGRTFGSADLLQSFEGAACGNFIRTLVGAALYAALIACAVAPVPEDLPAIAVRQVGLYRLEVALLVFYGALLLITPAFSGLIRGRLPIEISTRGARFAEDTDRSSEQVEAMIEGLELTISTLTEGLEAADLEIERLKDSAGRDSAQRGIDSRR